MVSFCLGLVLYDCKIVVYKSCRLVGCLTEKAVYDPPSSVAAAGAGDTFPRGEGKYVVCFFLGFQPPNIRIPKGFSNNETHKTEAFPAGEGADQRMRREADEGYA